MQRSLLIALTLLLAACGPQDTSQDIARYRHNADLRIVTIDDHRISVVPNGWGQYVAWGGEKDRDGRIQYRQRRAVEIVTKCRIKEVLSKKTDNVLHATVKC